MERAYHVDYLTSADQKIQTDWLRLHPWEALKLQLSWVLSLGLLMQDLAQMTPFEHCCFFFNTRYLYILSLL